MTAPRAPVLGSIVAGRYRVSGVLGVGGMAMVLRAEQLETRVQVALKLLSPEAAKVAETVARFEQEARVASEIRSDHVVSVIDFGRTEEGGPYLAMELLEGIDLANLIEQRKQLPPDEAVALVLQACAGVAAAHAAGLVHRDLKPANLFLARRRGTDPIVKVLDFGLSKVVARGEGVELTQTRSALGTPMYMSPEQVMASKAVDARCDQHALGMILYELLTGHPPYEFDTAPALAVAIATHPPPSARAYVPDLPAPLDRAIRRALAKRPEDRFADLGQLARALEPFAPAGGSEMAAAIEVLLVGLRGDGDGLEAVSTSEMRLPDGLLGAAENLPTSPMSVPAGLRTQSVTTATASPVTTSRAAAGGRKRWSVIAVVVVVALAAVGLIALASGGRLQPDAPAAAASPVATSLAAAPSATEDTSRPAPAAVASSAASVSAAPPPTPSAAPATSPAPRTSGRPATAPRPPSRRDPLGEYD